MWSRILTVHAQVVADNEHLATAKFFNYKYQPGVMSHVAAIEQMGAHLKELNGPISEIQVMSKILQTLPPSYRHFLSAWDNIPRDVKNDQATNATSCSRGNPYQAIQQWWVRPSLRRQADPYVKSEAGFLSSICFTARRSFDWYADSGATKHMTNQRFILTNFLPINPED